MRVSKKGRQFWNKRAAYTCKGDLFLKSIITDKTLEKEVRLHADKTMDAPKLSKDEKEYIKALNRDQPENLRTAALKRFSDEAIDELSITIRVRRQENNCR